MTEAEMLYGLVISRQSVWSAHAPLPGADAQAQCRQWSKAYFSNAAPTVIDDALCMELERPVSEPFSHQLFRELAESAPTFGNVTGQL